MGLVVDVGTLSDRAPAGLDAAFFAELLKILPELETNKSFVSGLRDDPSLRLGHVIAGVALELQKIAGADVDYAAVNLPENNAPALRELLYGFWDSEFGVAAGRAAVSLVARLADDSRASRVNPGRARQILLSYIAGRSLDMSTTALVREAIKRDIPWRRLNERKCYVRFGQGKYQKFIRETMMDGATSIGALLSKVKGLLNEMLRKIGVPASPQGVIVIDGGIADGAERAAAQAKAIGYPVVVKPLDREKGLGVSVNLGDGAAVRKAVEEASKYGRAVIVEKFIAGDDHGILVVGGKMIAAAKRIPGHVVGDGGRTIAKLVEEANQGPRRGTDYEKIMVLLEFDAEAQRVLSAQGLTRDSVPAPGRIAYLCGADMSKSNLHEAVFGLATTDPVSMRSVDGRETGTIKKLNLSHADLRKSDLIGMDLANCETLGAIFK